MGWGGEGKGDFGGKGWGGGGGGRGFKVKKENEASTVWLGNIPPGITSEEIKANFASAGTVKVVELIKQGKEGFAWFSTPEEATTAISMFNGAAINGQAIQVDPWTRKETNGDTWSNAKGKSKGADWGSKGGVMMPQFGMWGSSGGKGFGGKDWGGKGYEGGGKGWGGGGKGWGGGGKGRGFKVKSENAAATVWIGNVPAGVTPEEIKTNFEAAGTVKVLELIKQGKEGFAWFSSPEEAQNAIAMFNGAAINGQAIQVDPWTRKEKE